MSNDLRDNQYVALELTKIIYNDNKGLSYGSVITTYEDCLKQLTNLIDETETILSLKDEIEKLQKENKELKSNNRDILEPFCNALIKILDECKPNMEPYVYDALYNYIKIVKA